MKRILFASIVPFWNRSTGAEQRIFSMVRVLEHHGWQVRTFFPGHAEDTDQARAKELKLDVVFASSNQMPMSRSMLGRLQWRIAGAVNAVTPSSPASDGPLRPLCLGDFKWDWASDAFNDLVTDFSPVGIVCEYITMGYLVAGLPKADRKSIHCLIDTHDVLSERQLQFGDHGRDHWLDVSPEEEAEALRQFDTIIAIQSAEAKTFQKMLPSPNVVVAGHYPIDESIGVPIDAKKDTSQKSAPTTRGDSQPFTLGYLGSNNASNVDAISGFLKTVWSQFKDDTRVGLVIAGNVCDGLAEDFEESQFPNVRRLGKVADVCDFYSAVDAVVNPVGYGTGLKIKSVEAIAFGCPLLCTAAGWSGDTILGVTEVNELSEMAIVIKSWQRDSLAFEELKRSVAEAELDDQWQSAYGQLLSLLESLAGQGSGESKEEN